MLAGLPFSGWKPRSVADRQYRPPSPYVQQQRSSHPPSFFLYRSVPESLQDGTPICLVISTLSKKFIGPESQPNSVPLVAVRQSALRNNKTSTNGRVLVLFGVPLLVTHILLTLLAYPIATVISMPWLTKSANRNSPEGVNLQGYFRNAATILQIPQTYAASD